MLNIAPIPPTVEIRNTPNLAYFDHRSWVIVLAHWPTLDWASQQFFLGLADTAEGAAGLFVALFNEFLVAHEMTHWLQRTLELDRDRYASEREANDVAVAFFCTLEGGEARLLELYSRLETALDRLSNPTPRGADEAQFFNDHYGELARNPSLYGYYQFRFILDSIAHRGDLRFESLVRGMAAE